MDNQQQKGGKKKDAILSAAISLFQQYHPNKVSIRDIATKANVSVVTIYNHFNGKEGLIFEVVRKVVEQQMGRFKRIVEGGESFPDKIQSLIFNQTESLNDFHADFLAFIMSEPIIQEYLIETHQKTSSHMLQKLIEQGKEDGYINSNLSISLIMNVFELFRRDLTSKDSLLLSDPNDYDKVFEIIIYGIAGKDREEK
ncbi:TetR/AcrR family transcriptional regulator [Shimazuella kribbensis]|uniref:TetR/AcrR family transcriptional regulator n=1 Tax=Shimazuella kribbensis TaxID=139808 RepID=UPI000422BA97|nr:TetR/AcrR family transcriptional regulator [Shimazuella kribbensis]